VTRWRRPGAGEILLVYVLLATIGAIVSGFARGVGPKEPLSSLVVMAFLAWRVSRGGRFSRGILVIGTGVLYAAAVLAVARLWDLTVMALVIIYAAQVALVISQPVYGRTRRPMPVLVRAPGWAQLARRPPVWLLPWGLLAGALLTLAYLGNSDWSTIAGCRPAGADACTALVEGYPLRWLTAYQNVPLISKGALFKDCAQWTLASMSVLYLAWPQRTAAASLPD
jgi:hypothetical protein